jgi:hypothetical protein
MRVITDPVSIASKFRTRDQYFGAAAAPGLGSLFSGLFSSEKSAEAMAKYRQSLENEQQLKVLQSPSPSRWVN